MDDIFDGFLLHESNQHENDDIIYVDMSIP